ncbi:MAG: hypothetical protein ACI9EW_000910 [Cellvibrionaceae bacterium]
MEFLMNLSEQQPPPLISATSAQLERQKRRKRFNRLTVYLPIGLMAAFIIAIIGFMLWRTLFTDSESTPQWQEFSSATADIVIIMTILPMILFVALISILAVGWTWYTWTTPRPVESWIQKWLWRTDTFIEDSATKVETTSKKGADLSIQYRATLTRIGRVIERIFGFVLPIQARNQNIERK